MNNWKSIIESKGNIEPWGRDFWNENWLGEMIILFGGTALVFSIVVVVGALIIKYLFF